MTTTKRSHKKKPSLPVQLRPAPALPTKEQAVAAGVKCNHDGPNLVLAIPSKYLWDLCGGSAKATNYDIHLVLDHLMQFFEINPDGQVEIGHGSGLTLVSQKIEDSLIREEKLDLDDLATELFKRMGLQTPMALKVLKLNLENTLLFEKKNLAYGTGNISCFGELGVLVRSNDKVERLKTLLNRDENPSWETREDSWRDLSIHAAIGLLTARGDWK